MANHWRHSEQEKVEAYKIMKITEMTAEQKTKVLAELDGCHRDGCEYDEEWFNADWRTPAQTRDLLIELSHPITLERIQELRSLCEQEIIKRKDDLKYVQCPLCKGFHDQLNNIDNLCEKHEQQTAPLRYDKARS